MALRDDHGQWLLLSAVIVSIGLGALVLLLNNAVLSGHSSTQAITSFPKNELRDLRSTAINEVRIIGENINRNPHSTDKSGQFNTNFTLFSDDDHNLAILHGGLVDITAVPDVYVNDIDGTSIIAFVTVKISYIDSSTTYTNDLLIGFQE